MPKIRQKSRAKNASKMKISLDALKFADFINIKWLFSSRK